MQNMFSAENAYYVEEAERNEADRWDEDADYQAPAAQADLQRGMPSAFNQDIGMWDVSNVTNMQAMFMYATSFNQDIGEWNVSNVTDMSAMFWGAANFNQDISSWDISKAVYTQEMFKDCNIDPKNKPTPPGLDAKLGGGFTRKYRNHIPRKPRKTRNLRKMRNPRKTRKTRKMSKLRKIRKPRKTRNI
jgi:surface protein